MKNKAVIIFDMDGTLYQIDGKNSGYIGSTLEKAVINNAQKFVIKKGFVKSKSAAAFIDEILLSGEGISKYLFEKYGVDRKEYFSFVWQINPDGIAQNFLVSQSVIKFLAENNYKLILLTGAPKIWQSNVLKYLDLEKYFDEIYVAEDFFIKDEIFEKLSKRFNPEFMWSIGDQLETDIIPAQKYGIKTMLVNDPNDLINLMKMIAKKYDK